MGLVDKSAGRIHNRQCDRLPRSGLTQAVARTMMLLPPPDRSLRYRKVTCCPVLAFTAGRVSELPGSRPVSALKRPTVEDNMGVRRGCCGLECQQSCTSRAGFYEVRRVHTSENQRWDGSAPGSPSLICDLRPQAEAVSGRRHQPSPSFCQLL